MINYIITVLQVVSGMKTHNQLLYFVMLSAGSTHKITSKTYKKEPPEFGKFLNHLLLYLWVTRLPDRSDNLGRSKLEPIEIILPT